MSGFSNYDMSSISKIFSVAAENRRAFCQSKYEEGNDALFNSNDDNYNIFSEQENIFSLFSFSYLKHFVPLPDEYISTEFTLHGSDYLYSPHDCHYYLTFVGDRLKIERIAGPSGCEEQAGREGSEVYRAGGDLSAGRIYIPNPGLRVVTNIMEAEIEQVSLLGDAGTGTDLLVKTCFILALRLDTLFSGSNKLMFLTFNHEADPSITRDERIDTYGLVDVFELLNFSCYNDKVLFAYNYSYTLVVDDWSNTVEPVLLEVYEARKILDNDDVTYSSLSLRAKMELVNLRFRATVSFFDERRRMVRPKQGSYNAYGNEQMSKYLTPTDATSYTLVVSNNFTGTVYTEVWYLFGTGAVLSTWVQREQLTVFEASMIEIFPMKDGWVSIIGGDDSDFPPQVTAFGAPKDQDVQVAFSLAPHTGVTTWGGLNFTKYKFYFFVWSGRTPKVVTISGVPTAKKFEGSFNQYGNEMITIVCGDEVYRSPLTAREVINWCATNTTGNTFPYVCAMNSQVVDVPEPEEQKPARNGRSEARHGAKEGNARRTERRKEATRAWMIKTYVDWATITSMYFKDLVSIRRLLEFSRVLGINDDAFSEVISAVQQSRHAFEPFLRKGSCCALRYKNDVANIVSGLKLTVDDTADGGASRSEEHVAIQDVSEASISEEEDAGESSVENADVTSSNHDDDELVEPPKTQPESKVAMLSTEDASLIKVEELLSTLSFTCIDAVRDGATRLVKKGADILEIQNYIISKSITPKAVEDTTAYERIVSFMYAIKDDEEKTVFQFDDITYFLSRALEAKHKAVKVKGPIPREAMNLVDEAAGVFFLCVDKCADNTDLSLIWDFKEGGFNVYGNTQLAYVTPGTLEALDNLAAAAPKAEPHWSETVAKVFEPDNNYIGKGYTAGVRGGNNPDYTVKPTSRNDEWARIHDRFYELGEPQASEIASSIAPNTALGAVMTVYNWLPSTKSSPSLPFKVELIVMIVFFVCVLEGSFNPYGNGQTTTEPAVKTLSAVHREKKDAIYQALFDLMKLGASGNYTSQFYETFFNPYVWKLEQTTAGGAVQFQTRTPNVPVMAWVPDNSVNTASLTITAGGAWAAVGANNAGRQMRWAGKMLYPNIQIPDTTKVVERGVMDAVAYTNTTDIKILNNLYHQGFSLTGNGLYTYLQQHCPKYFSGYSTCFRKLWNMYPWDWAPLVSVYSRTVAGPPIPPVPIAGAGALRGPFPFSFAAGIFNVIDATVMNLLSYDRVLRNNVGGGVINADDINRCGAQMPTRSDIAYIPWYGFMSQWDARMQCAYILMWLEYPFFIKQYTYTVAGVVGNVRSAAQSVCVSGPKADVVFVVPVDAAPTITLNAFAGGGAIVLGAPELHPGAAPLNIFPWMLPIVTELFTLVAPANVIVWRTTIQLLSASLVNNNICLLDEVLEGYIASVYDRFVFDYTQRFLAGVGNDTTGVNFSGASGFAPPYMFADGLVPQFNLSDIGLPPSAQVTYPSPTEILLRTFYSASYVGDRVRTPQITPPFGTIASIVLKHSMLKIEATMRAFTVELPLYGPFVIGATQVNLAALGPQARACFTAVVVAACLRPSCFSWRADTYWQIPGPGVVTFNFRTASVQGGFLDDFNYDWLCGVAKKDDVWVYDYSARTPINIVLPAAYPGGPYYRVKKDSLLKLFQYNETRAGAAPLCITNAHGNYASKFSYRSGGVEMNAAGNAFVVVIREVACWAPSKQVYTDNSNATDDYTIMAAANQAVISGDFVNFTQVPGVVNATTTVASSNIVDGTLAFNETAQIRSLTLAAMNMTLNVSPVAAIEIDVAPGQRDGSSKADVTQE